MDRLTLYVWNKGFEVSGLDPRLWRRDLRNRLIYFFALGDRDHRHGWERGKIIASADGGTDIMFNLRPEHVVTSHERRQEVAAREKVSAVGTIPFASGDSMTMYMF